MSKEKMAEIIARHLYEAFDAAMLEIEIDEGVESGDCEPFLWLAISSCIDRASAELGEYARTIVEQNRVGVKS